MTATTLRYRRLVSIGLASNAINLSTSSAMGHRVQIPMSIADMNSFFTWSRQAGTPRAVGHFNPSGAGSGAPSFLVSLASSLGLNYTDMDGLVSGLNFASSALEAGDDSRLRPGGVPSVNDWVMAYVLFKCFGKSSYLTADDVYNLEDAQNMVGNFDVANAIQTSLQQSDASGVGNYVDNMFTNLLAADPMRFFDASGKQMAGLFETNADATGSGSWNFVANDIMEIPLQITFTAPVTLNSVRDTAGELSGNTAPSLIVKAGDSFNIRLQLVASTSVPAPGSQTIVIDPTVKPFSRNGTQGNIADSWVSGVGINSRGIAQNAETGEVFFLNNFSDTGSIYKVVTDTQGNITGTMLVAGGRVPNHIDGIGQSAALYGPVAITYAGNDLFYIGGGSEKCIRVFNSSTNEVSTLAGNKWLVGSADGNGTAASFNNIFGLTMGSDGNLYVSDAGNGALRCVTPAGDVTTVAGHPATANGVPTDGVGEVAGFTYQMGGCAGDSSGNIYICDNNALRKFEISTGTVTTLSLSGAVGNADGDLGSASFAFLKPNGVSGGGGLWMDKASNRLWVADPGNSSVRYVNLTAGSVTTFLTAADINATIDAGHIQPTAILRLPNGSVLMNLPSYLPSSSIASVTFDAPIV